eukprot:m.349091 g.349091  ORF g.349091 m.349091 type:complete len:360 (+) comp20684_c0_seq1:112-1191(+)
MDAEDALWSGDQTGTNSAPLRRDKRKKRENGKPKKSRSAYVIYVVNAREEYARLHPELSFPEVTKALGNQWSSMSDIQKEPYLLLAHKEKEEYEAKVRTWKEQQPLVEPGHEEKRARYNSTGNVPEQAQVGAATASNQAVPSTTGAAGSDGGTYATGVPESLGCVPAYSAGDEDLYCKLCDRYFKHTGAKREHLLSKKHNRKLSAQSKPTPTARDVALTMPVFTPEFKRHYERREQLLRGLRKENDELERSTSALVDRVQKLTAGNLHISKVQAETEKATCQLVVDVASLRRSIEIEFSGIALPSRPEIPSGGEETDNYLSLLATALTNKELDKPLRDKCVEAASRVVNKFTQGKSDDS